MLLLISLVWWMPELYGQPIPDSLRIEVRGSMPLAFQKTAAKRLDDLQYHQADSLNRYQAYFHRTAAQLTDYLHGGKVMYNDFVSLYLDKVMDSLLIAEPSLRKKLQVFTVMDGTPNASVTPDGLVLVNVGLIAQVETEAELAFVISHEISHYARQHALRRLSNGQKTAMEDSPLAMDLYNQAQEREADQAGFTRMLRTRYSPQAAITVFGRLGGAGLSFPARPLDLAWLAPEGRGLPVCGGTIASIPKPSMLNSHPLPQSRRDALFSLAKLVDSGQANDFLVGKRPFLRARLAARHYITRIALQERRYEDALTMAYNLWRDYPAAIFSHRVASRALYGLSAYADAGRLYEVHFPPKTQKMARLACLIETLSARELNALALHYTWRQFTSGDATTLPWFRDLGFRLANNHKATIDVIAPPESLSATWLSAILEDTQTLPLLAASLTKGWETPQQDSSTQHDKIILVSPSYQHIDVRKGKFADLKKRTRDEKRFERLLKEQLTALGYELQIIRKTDADAFRYLTHIQQWEAEKRLHGTTTILSSQLEVGRALVKHFETPLFLWAGVVAETDKKDKKILRLLAGLPILPFTLVKTFSPKHTTFIYSLLYHLEEDQAVYLDSRSIPRVDRYDVVSSTLYDMLTSFPR